MGAIYGAPSENNELEVGGSQPVVPAWWPLSSEHIRKLFALLSWMKFRNHLPSCSRNKVSSLVSAVTALPRFYQWHQSFVLKPRFKERDMQHWHAVRSVNEPINEENPAVPYFLDCKVEVWQIKWVRWIQLPHKRHQRAVWGKTLNWTNASWWHYFPGKPYKVLVSTASWDHDANVQREREKKKKTGRRIGLMCLHVFVASCFSSPPQAS